MDHFFTRFRRLMRHSMAVGTLVTLLGSLPGVATAAGTTLLVNTESFQTIDAGDGSTNIELRFGNSTKTIKFLTTNKFQFSHGISVLGNMSGSSLHIDGDSIIKGTLSASGATRLESTLQVDGATTLNSTAAINGNTTITGNTRVRGFLSGSVLRVDGMSELYGAVNASGSIATRQNLTINSDADTSNAVLTFGNNTANQSITFNNASQKFDFSKDIRVQGNMSGRTLTVDGNITLRGVTYSAPTSQGSANTFLRNDGAGNLTWQSVSVGNSSGGIMSLHPEYPNAIYFASGSVANAVGQLSHSGGTAALDNTYVWTSTKAALNEYWISVRFRLPNNFVSWDAVTPIQLRYKTGVASAAANHVTIRMKDTAGVDRPLTNGGGLANTNFTTATVTGPEAGGTWTPGGYATVYIKVAANNTAGAYAAVGFVNFVFDTSTP